MAHTKTSYYVFFLTVAFLCVPPTLSAAQAETIPESIKPSLTVTTGSSNKTKTQDINYFYEKPTIDKLSQAYWALSKPDLGNDEQSIDFFMMINECEIYKQYSQNEIEWLETRKAAYKSIQSNIKNYSLRFELIQPIGFGEYDPSKQIFEVRQKFKIEGVRHFEVLADNYEDSVCGYDPSRSGRPIPKYPRALIIELSRPVGLIGVPMRPDQAAAYLKEKTSARPSETNVARNKEEVYDQRTAYLVMKVKLFSHKKDVTPRGSGVTFAEVMAILESIEVYSDPKKKNLLYSEDYRRKKKNVGSLKLLAAKKAEYANSRTGLLAPDVPSLLPVKNDPPAQKTAQ